MSSDVIDLQVSERLTALKAACTVLEAKQGGKFGEAKLQKALAKLEKAENPLLSQPSAAAAAPVFASAAESRGQAADIEGAPGQTDAAQPPVSLSPGASCPELCKTDVCHII